MRRHCEVKINDAQKPAGHEDAAHPAGRVPDGFDKAAGGKSSTWARQVLQLEFLEPLPCKGAEW
jgi:hypothetical protein